MDARSSDKTAPDLIRDRLGEGLDSVYVVARDPVSGEKYEPFGLVAAIDPDKIGQPEATDIGSELATELMEKGFDVPFTVVYRELSGSEVLEI